MPEAVGGEVAAEEGGNKWKGKNGGEPAEAGDSEELGDLLLGEVNGDPEKEEAEVEATRPLSRDLSSSSDSSGGVGGVEAAAAVRTGVKAEAASLPLLPCKRRACCCWAAKIAAAG